jgi:hypothetical protein
MIQLSFETVSDVRYPPITILNGNLASFRAFLVHVDAQPKSGHGVALTMC